MKIRKLSRTSSGVRCRFTLKACLIFEQGRSRSLSRSLLRQLLRRVKKQMRLLCKGAGNPMGRVLPFVRSGQRICDLPSGLRQTFFFIVEVIVKMHDQKFDGFLNFGSRLSEKILHSKIVLHPWNNVVDSFCAINGLFLNIYHSVSPVENWNRIS